MSFSCSDQSSLERFDRSWSTDIQIETRDRFMKLRPGERISDYVRRHVEEGRIYLGCEGEEAMLPVTIDALGTNKPFMFCSDFPHEINVTTCRYEIEELLENQKQSCTKMPESSTGCKRRNGASDLS